MEDPANIIEIGINFVPVRLEDGIIIRIEATPMTPTTGQEDYIGVEIPSFEEVTNTIRSISKSVVSVWKEVQPKKASVEFALEIGFEPGHITALLVKGSGKANLKITLEWDSSSSNTDIAPGSTATS